MDDNKHLAELLRERQLKATSARIELLKVVSDYKKAIPFSEIQKALHKLDRVTLYRNIQALLENGIIHKAFKENNETFYAICSRNCTSNAHNHRHIHFKCTSCKAVTCLQVSHPISLSIPGYSINNFEIEATGLCVSCRA